MEYTKVTPLKFKKVIEILTEELGLPFPTSLRILFELDIVTIQRNEIFVHCYDPADWARYVRQRILDDMNGYLNSGIKYERIINADQKIETILHYPTEDMDEVKYVMLTKLGYIIFASRDNYYDRTYADRVELYRKKYGNVDDSEIAIAMSINEGKTMEQLCIDEYFSRNQEPSMVIPEMPASPNVPGTEFYKSTRKPATAKPKISSKPKEQMRVQFGLNGEVERSYVNVTQPMMPAPIHGFRATKADLRAVRERNGISRRVIAAPQPVARSAPILALRSPPPAPATARPLLTTSDMTDSPAAQSQRRKVIMPVSNGAKDVIVRGTHPKVKPATTAPPQPFPIRDLVPVSPPTFALPAQPERIVKPAPLVVKMPPPQSSQSRHALEVMYIVHDDDSEDDDEEDFPPPPPPSTYFDDDDDDDDEPEQPIGQEQQRIIDAKRALKHVELPRVLMTADELLAIETAEAEAARQLYDDEDYDWNNDYLNNNPDDDFGNDIDYEDDIDGDLNTARKNAVIAHLRAIAFN